MHEHIHPKTSDTLSVQQQVIKRYLDEKMKRGEIKSTSEYQAEWNAYTAKLTGSTTFTHVRPQEEVTDSRAHNETFQEIGLDLQAAYQQINNVSENLAKHKRLNQSIVNNMKLRLKRVNNELSKQERLMDAEDAGELHYETFTDANSFETDYTYYTERNGKQVPIDTHARWDLEGESLKLPLAASDNGLIGAGGIRLGTLTIRKKLGSTMTELRNPLQDTDKAIDTNPETYWSESISMDAPIQVDMGDAYYNVKFGALVELEVHFDYVTPINEIGLSAFGEYPLDVVAIEYFETDNANEAGIPLVHPHTNVEDLKSRSFEGTTAFQFPDVSAKRLRIILNQRHYTKKNRMVSEKQQRNRSLWLSARSGEAVHEIGISEYDIERILELTERDEQEAVTKYEYQYGLYNLSIKRNEYNNTGFYVSKPIPVQQNVKTMRLETMERHPEYVDDLQLTDIEYYVHDGRQWYPIMPFTKDHVASELLTPVFEGGQYKAKTRFRVYGNAVIRKNGVPAENVALLDDKETVLFGEYDASAYYTIAYTPVEESWYLDFLEQYKDENGEVQPEYSKEEMKGTDSKGRVKLKYPPFVDKAKLNTQTESYDPSFLENGYIPITVKLIDQHGYHITQPMNDKERGIYIQNVTDYDQTGQSQLKAFSTETPVYQYEVVDGYLQFNTVIPESTRILVEYPYLVNHVRVKAILRRNIPGFYGMTPVLEDYIVHFQTLL